MKGYQSLPPTSFCRLRFPPSAVLLPHPFEPSQYYPDDKDGMTCDGRYLVSPCCDQGRRYESDQPKSDKQLFELNVDELWTCALRLTLDIALKTAHISMIQVQKDVNTTLISQENF
jgi:hypothetical protein